MFHGLGIPKKIKTEAFGKTTEYFQKMYQTSQTTSISSVNTVWLRVEDGANPTMLRGHLIGMGSDHSMLCGIPTHTTWKQFKVGMTCHGHTVIEGETYQFQTTIKEVRQDQPALLLHNPPRITRRPPRTHPRVPVDISGTIRPTDPSGAVLAVLPATLIDLCTMGCQLTTSETTWPNLATLTVILSCRLPNIDHTSKFHGRIEWITPNPELQMGIQFQFSSFEDVACRDLERWFGSQQAKLINTVA
ncbi:MAG: flagellar brake domain-containing protein [Nitrospirae bacterium]|nr:flagellar brake domain-containing protein [Nitrospirota bacterium]MDA1304390.1 flagellar brake domain-containing protein [Nitrospirota bacterium]